MARVTLKRSNTCLEHGESPLSISASKEGLRREPKRARKQCGGHPHDPAPPPRERSRAGVTPLQSEYGVVWRRHVEVVLRTLLHKQAALQRDCDVHRAALHALRRQHAELQQQHTALQQEVRAFWLRCRRRRCSSSNGSPCQIRPQPLVLRQYLRRVPTPSAPWDGPFTASASVPRRYTVPMVATMDVGGMFRQHAHEVIELLQ